MAVPYGSVAELLHSARAQAVEGKLQRAQLFFAKLDADDIELLRRDPRIAQQMTVFARELLVIASAVGPETVSIEDVEAA
jgi:hypothetical protein